MTASTLDDHDRAELEAYRNGYGQLAKDAMHAGQPVHPIYSYEDDETRYWLQITHAYQPLWQCHVCGKGNLGPWDGAAPARCVGCDHGGADDMTPLLYADTAACWAWTAKDGGQYDGSCLIPGTDGCGCEEQP